VGETRDFVKNGAWFPFGCVFAVSPRIFSSVRLEQSRVGDFADVGVTVLVISNSLRLLNFK
jgi:hypothetical protein